MPPPWAAPLNGDSRYLKPRKEGAFLYGLDLHRAMFDHTVSFLSGLMFSEEHKKAPGTFEEAGSSEKGFGYFYLIRSRYSSRFPTIRAIRSSIWSRVSLSRMLCLPTNSSTYRCRCLGDIW